MELHSGETPTLSHRRNGDRMLFQMFLPESERTGRHRKTDGSHLPSANCSTKILSQRKESENGARRSDGIAVIEMVGVWIVKLYSTFDQPETAEATIKVEV